MNETVILAKATLSLQRIQRKKSKQEQKNTETFALLIASTTFGGSI